ncbi:hypothetical protein FRC07_004354 [Ceratobasidium sp. 392]|nr:hypothetical protein FRC07_004354 [Ceratobasidium sp. 392]
MLADDPTDQAAARTLEASLRAAVARRERPPVELQWFLALPERTRRSGRLLEVAIAESLVLLERLREDWDRAREVEREREERLARAKAAPRDLECLHTPDGHPWHGVGRRKQRVRRFDSIGRTYTLRHARAHPTSTPQAPVEAPLLSVDVALSPSPPVTQSKLLPTDHHVARAS